jgi:hemerythrin
MISTAGDNSMALFTWSDSFSVKIRLFDSQHQQLFDLINQLHDSMIVGKGKEVIGGVLKSLLTYTKTHFTEEERQLKMYKYPGYEQQVQEHSVFVQRIAELQKNHDTGNAAITLTTLNFLRDWLQKHINGDDKKYSSYLNSKGVS